MRTPHARPGAADPMELGEDGVGIAEVLDHVLEQDLVEARVLERPRHGVQVVDDVGIGVGRPVDAHRARVLLGSAADVEQLTRVRRHGARTVPDR